jgi:hypothetical protein
MSLPDTQAISLTVNLRSSASLSAFFHYIAVHPASASQGTLRAALYILPLPWDQARQAQVYWLML